MQATHPIPPAASVTRSFGAQSMIEPLRRALVHLPGPEYTAKAWKNYGLAGEPDRDAAITEQRRFLEILELHGVELVHLTEHTSIQCTATYDPALITDRGAVILTSGRPERRAEALPMARKLLELEIPILGWVGGDGHMDAGDSLWLDHDTLLVTRGYRTNAIGIAQLRRALDGVVGQIIEFELPHWEGPAHVLHLMSVLSLVHEDVAVVYPRAAPVRLLELLRDREYRLIEVSDAEFGTQASNVLAITPGLAVICAGNPHTSAALRQAGIELHEYAGEHISVRRVAGPTCNTRPLLRA